MTAASSCADVGSSHNRAILLAPPITELSKEPKRQTVVEALEMLRRMTHRGACGCDKGAFVVRRCRRADRAAALLVGRPRTAWQSAHGCGTARPVRKPGLRPGSSIALRPCGCAPSFGAVPSPFLAARPAVRGRVWWKERKKS